jgi:DNA repair exonuclease SbcCD nuclease subunit
LAADLYARLGGLRLFSEPDGIEYDLFDRAGMRVAIGGLCWDSRSIYGDDPLAGRSFENPPEGRPDWKLLIAHASLEGHAFPGAFEPVISRDSIAKLDADLLLSGHVHARTYFEVGGTHVLVPGATERMHLGEFGHDPGYLVIELLERGKFRHEWVTFPAQPRCRISVTGHELTPQPIGLRPPALDPTDALLQRVEEHRQVDCITTLSIEGRLPREVYAQLDLVKVQEAGAAASFFFEIDTTLLEPENEFGQSSSRGIRLSQVEELQETAQLLRDAAVSHQERRLIELGLSRVLSFYHQGDTAG